MEQARGGPIQRPMVSNFCYLHFYFILRTSYSDRNREPYRKYLVPATTFVLTSTIIGHEY